MPPEAIPVAVAVSDTANFAKAAEVLERAVQGGCQDANVLYMLGMAHKRQGKINESRTALRKIGKPDANVILQMALLSLDENNLAQAEGEFERAWGMDATSYEICYNLLLTRLTLGKTDGCLELIPRALELIQTRSGPHQDEETHFLQVLHALLRACKKGGNQTEQSLVDLSPQDEQRLLRIVRSLGQLDTVHTLLHCLAEARPRSMPVREAYIEAVLVKGKELIDRCHFTEAEILLRPLTRERGYSRNSQIALLNLMGCCACATQDFDGAVRNFQAALKQAPNDARLHQNLALTYELQNDLASADPHWNRYFDLLGDEVPGPEDIKGYLEQLTYESLTRLSSKYRDKERWNSALSYMQRASQVRPSDSETLEQLFQLFHQAKRPQDARRTLDQMRRIKPGEPQYELYELDLIDVKGLNDIERLLTDIDRIRKRYPGDARVEERAVSMVNNVIPLMGQLCDQLTDQMGKVIDQVRNLPNYQINWAAVREVMRDLMKEFQKLRRITGKCLPLVNTEEHRRMVRDLADHIDKKMEACRSMGA